MTDKPKFNDYPFGEIAVACADHIAKGRTINQKFTCAKCGTRQTIEEANKLFTSGTCEECGHVTDITKTGCNYMLQGQGTDMLDFLFGKEPK